MGEDKGSMLIEHKPMIVHILNTLNGIIDEAIIVLNDRSRIVRYEEMINYYGSDCGSECENLETNGINSKSSTSRIGRFNYNIKFFEDEIEDKGPMSGILTGLKNTNSNYNLIIPCDSPYISEEFIENSFNYINNISNVSKKENEIKIDCVIPYNNSAITYNEKDTNNYDIKLNNSQPLHGIYSKNCITIINELLESDNRSMKSLIKKVNSYFIKEEDFDKNRTSFRNINTKEDLEHY